MASPQLENGFARIINEILEKTAAAHLSGAQLAIVLIVWRYTYGFSRPSHSLSEKFISKATELSLRHVKRELAMLLSADILRTVKKPVVGIPREIAFNTDYSRWRTGHRKAKSSGDADVTDMGDGYVTAMGDGYVTAMGDGYVTAMGDGYVTAMGDGYVTAAGDGSVTQERKEKEKIKKDLCIHPSFQDLFDRFWEAYPRRQAKQEAMKVFGNLNPDEELLTEIIAAVGRQKISEDWMRGGGRYIPMPATYLGGRRWEDEKTALPAGWAPGLKYINDNWKGKKP